MGDALQSEYIFISSIGRLTHLPTFFRTAVTMAIWARCILTILDTQPLNMVIAWAFSAFLTFLIAMACP